MPLFSRDGSLLSDEQRLVQRSIREICEDFEQSYWRECARANEYPHEFVDALAEGGWLSVLVPEEYGGAGMDTPEVAVMMEEIAASGSGFSATQAIHVKFTTQSPS